MSGCGGKYSEENEDVVGVVFDRRWVSSGAGVWRHVIIRVNDDESIILNSWIPSKGKQRGEDILSEPYGGAEAKTLIRLARQARNTLQKARPRVSLTCKRESSVQKEVVKEDTTQDGDEVICCDNDAAILAAAIKAEKQVKRRIFWEDKIEKWVSSNRPRRTVHTKLSNAAAEYCIPKHILLNSYLPSRDEENEPAVSAKKKLKRAL